jgi:hypothetical protein
MVGDAETAPSACKQMFEYNKQKFGFRRWHKIEDAHVRISLRGPEQAGSGREDV